MNSCIVREGRGNAPNNNGAVLWRVPYPEHYSEWKCRAWYSAPYVDVQNHYPGLYVQVDAPEGLVSRCIIETTTTMCDAEEAAIEWSKPFLERFTARALQITTRLAAINKFEEECARIVLTQPIASDFRMMPPVEEIVKASKRSSETQQVKVPSLDSVMKRRADESLKRMDVENGPFLSVFYNKYY